MIDDIEFLVAETFSNVHRQSEFLFNNSNSSKVFPETSGILYYLQKTETTLVIKAVASENLNQYIREMQSGNMDCFNKLKLNQDSDWQEDIHFFELNDLSLAESIIKQMANRRFPIHEERMFNVSDPSMSWWLKVDSLNFEIFYQMTNTHQISKLIKLGPIYDGLLANQRFQKLFAFLKFLMPIKNISVQPGHAQISVMQINGYFEQFKMIFEKGEMSSELKSYLNNLTAKVHPSHQADWNQSLNFINEISIARKFWLEIQKKMN